MIPDHIRIGSVCTRSTYEISGRFFVCPGDWNQRLERDKIMCSHVRSNGAQYFVWIKCSPGIGSGAFLWAYNFARMWNNIRTRTCVCACVESDFIIFFSLVRFLPFRSLEHTLAAFISIQNGNDNTFDGVVLGSMNALCVCITLRSCVNTEFK